jgi:hypothetical protein
VLVELVAANVVGRKERHRVRDHHAAASQGPGMFTDVLIWGEGHLEPESMLAEYARLSSMA